MGEVRSLKPVRHNLLIPHLMPRAAAGDTSYYVSNISR